MTLQEVRDWIAAHPHLHPLTPVDIEGLSITAGRVVPDIDETEAEAALAEARSNIATLESDLKQADAESSALNSELDRITDAEWDAADRADEIERIRAMANTQANRCERLEREAQVLRKRKGVAAGVCAYSHDVMALLWRIADSEGPHKSAAYELCKKINSV